MREIDVDLEIKHILGDQCVLGAASPKTTDWGCTKHFAPKGLVSRQHRGGGNCKKYS